MAVWPRQTDARWAMNRLLYDTAEALLYDPVSSNRMATRSALYALGFRKIETVGTVRAFGEFMRRRPPDLAICEVQGAGEQLCNEIQKLRQGTDGQNPFVVIIATAWEKNAALISRVVNSGADDLLLRPFSTALLQSRIDTHIQNRKGFVVTTDYVGPDRRRELPGPSNAELFEPPNSLKMKAKDRLTPEQAAQRLEFELKAARDVLKTEKLRRDAFQVCIQWRLIQDRTPDDPAYDAHLEKITQLARSIAKRCRDSDLEQSSDWCDSILAAVGGLELGVDRNASMHLLGHAARSLNLVFHPETTAQDQLHEIDATVALIRARPAEKLAS
jgi:DNA-binding response OmpR family regulator